MSNQEEDPARKGDSVETFIKKMLRTNRAGDTVDQKTFLVDSIRSFHARDCAIFRQMVTVLSRADAPNPVSVISDAINGQRGSQIFFSRKTISLGFCRFCRR